MKTVLILGAKGFIGSNCVTHFEKLGYNVVKCIHRHSFVRFGSQSYGCDLTVRKYVNELFEDVKPDIVIHAAAVTTGSKDVVERPYLHVTDNSCLNALILEHCHTYKVKHTIFFSCTVMYQPKDIPQKETDWKIEEEIYSAYFGVGSMKVYTERLCEFYGRLGNGKFTAIRHSNVYGPGDKFDFDKCHMLPAMVRKVCDATDEIEVWGTGKARRDLIYIDDLVDFVEKCLEKQEKPYELFNCGAGEALSIEEIISTLILITGKSLKINYNSTKPDIPTTVMLDCSKAKELLGWTKRTDIYSGLKETVEWYQKSYDNKTRTN